MLRHTVEMSDGRDPQIPTERVVVALTGASGNAEIIRRAARLAGGPPNALLGVHVRAGDSPRWVDPRLDEHRALLAVHGGEYHETVGADVAAALIAFANAEGATQLVLGGRPRGRIAEMLGRSVTGRVLRAASVDVHVMSLTDEGSDGVAREVRRPSWHRTRARHVTAWGVAVVLLPALTAVLVELGERASLASSLLLYVLVVVAIASIGGRVIALLSAAAAFLLANWYLTPPVHTWTIDHGQNVFALIVFLTVAAVVSNYVSIAARRAVESERARAEAESLARLSATFAESDPLVAVVAHLRSTFGLDAAAVLRRGPSSEWFVEASAGAEPPINPAQAEHVVDIREGVVLALTGRTLTGDDRRVLLAFAAQLGAAIERAELTRVASRAEALDNANALRTALLQAVSHDLRTPLAAIKASVSSLREPDITWSPEEHADFLAAIEDETDRLTSLVTNLLDLSRIQAGELHPGMRAVSLEEVVPAALYSLGMRGADVELDLPASLPDVSADPALLERVVANLTANAMRFSPPHCAVVVRAFERNAEVLLDVIDHGPGIAAADRVEAVRPFQRLDDSRQNGGVGLGLAIADGFTRAMRAQLQFEDTPGGGLTARIVLRVAPAVPSSASSPNERSS